MRRASRRTTGPGDDATSRVRNASVRPGDAVRHGAPAPSGTEPRQTLEQVLGQMPDELRVVFVLREVEGYTHVQIGSMLGITPATSELRLHRARKLLSARMKGRL